MADTHVVLYRASDRREAEFLSTALEAEGVPVVLSGGDSTLAFGEIGQDALRTDLWVASEDAERGRSVIERIQAERSAEGSTDGEATEWTCGACDETNEATFDLCWSCQAPRD